MVVNDPNPHCCYQPDVFVKFNRKRISVETVRRTKLAICPNCNTVKEVMDTEYIPYGG